MCGGRDDQPVNRAVLPLARLGKVSESAADERLVPATYAKVGSYAVVHATAVVDCREPLTLAAARLIEKVPHPRCVPGHGRKPGTERSVEAKAVYEPVEFGRPLLELPKCLEIRLRLRQQRHHPGVHPDIDLVAPLHRFAQIVFLDDDAVAPYVIAQEHNGKYRHEFQ